MTKSTPLVRLVIPLVLVLLSAIPYTASKYFTATDLHKMRKLSSPVIVEGKYSVYAVSIWDDVTDTSSTHLEYADLSSGASIALTNGNNDSSPVYNSAFPNVITFLSGRSGSSQVWYVPFPPASTLPTPVQLTNYLLGIDNFRFNGNSVVFSTEVYFECVTDIFKCTADKNKEVDDRGDNSYGVYNRMFVRHWDTWLTEGKGSHIFLQSVVASTDKLPQVDGEVVDLMKGMEANSPVPPYGGTDHFDVKADGTEVAFTLAERSIDEAWSTSWKTYLINPKVMNSPKYITQGIEARTQNPKYSPDGTKVAYLAMNRPKIESDNLHIEIYDTLSATVTKITDQFDRSIVDFTWYDGTTILFACTDINTNKLFYVDINNKSTITVLTNDTWVYNTPLVVDYNTASLIVQRSSWYTADELAVFTLDAKNKQISGLKSLINLNKDYNDEFQFKDCDNFNFTGGYGDKVYGWVCKPKDYVEGNTYPLAFLIHGGPEGAWDPAWSYRWNPQVYLSRNYATVMINPHGSTGQGIKFQDAVRDDWGGVPYKDLMTGLDFVLASYKWIDPERMCAVGASYGGYMVNWIQGQTDRFKCLITHDGVFSTLSMFYATEEIWFPYAEYCPRDQVGCSPYDSNYRERYLKFSPESYVQNWKTPHLIIHGSKDFRIPISEGLSAFTALQVKGIPSRFLHFNQENHWVLRQQNSIKWHTEVLGWMDQYTKTTPPTLQCESTRTHSHGFPNKDGLEFLSDEK